MGWLWGWKEIDAQCLVHWLWRQTDLTPVRPWASSSHAWSFICSHLESGNSKNSYLIWLLSIKLICITRSYHEINLLKMLAVVLSSYFAGILA